MAARGEEGRGCQRGGSKRLSLDQYYKEIKKRRVATCVKGGGEDRRSPRRTAVALEVTRKGPGGVAMKFFVSSRRKLRARAEPERGAPRSKGGPRQRKRGGSKPSGNALLSST